MDSRQAKITLLSRINREKAATPAMLTGLSKALCRQVEEKSLVDPLNFDTLMENFRTGYANALKSGALSYRRFFHRGELPIAENLAGSLAQQLGTEQVYLLTKFNGDDRGVLLDAATLFSRIGSIIEFDGDSLCALSEDRTQGVLLDHNPDDNGQTYELAVWGDRWPLLIFARDQVDHTGENTH